MIKALDWVVRLDPPEDAVGHDVDVRPAERDGLTQSAPDTYVFDANPRAMYEKRHLPGARWVPYDGVVAEMLPPDRSATVVFYCANRHLRWLAWRSSSRGGSRRRLATGDGCGTRFAGKPFTPQWCDSPMEIEPHSMRSSTTSGPSSSRSRSVASGAGPPPQTPKMLLRRSSSSCALESPTSTGRDLDRG